METIGRNSGPRAGEDPQQPHRLVQLLSDWRLVLLLTLTLGIAPLGSEPHIWGKLKWVWGGANGMSTMDWLDLAVHGIPWVLLIRLAYIKLARKN